jgi:hypothetical protein
LCYPAGSAGQIPVTIDVTAVARSVAEHPIAPQGDREAPARPGDEAWQQRNHPIVDVS